MEAANVPCSNGKRCGHFTQYLVYVWRSVLHTWTPFDTLLVYATTFLTTHRVCRVGRNPALLMKIQGMVAGQKESLHRVLGKGYTWRTEGSDVVLAHLQNSLLILG